MKQPANTAPVVSAGGPRQRSQSLHAAPLSGQHGRQGHRDHCGVKRAGAVCAAARHEAPPGECSRTTSRFKLTLCSLGLGLVRMTPCRPACCTGAPASAVGPCLHQGPASAAEWSSCWNAGLVLRRFSASVQAPLHANTDIIRSIVCTEQGFIFTVSYDRCIMIYEVSAASGRLLSGASMNWRPPHFQTATASCRPAPGWVPDDAQRP